MAETEDKRVVTKQDLLETGNSTDHENEFSLPQIPQEKMKTTSQKHSIFPPLASHKIKESRSYKHKSSLASKGEKYSSERSKESQNISELIREVKEMKKLATEIGLDKEMLVAERNYDQTGDKPGKKYHLKRRMSWKNSMKFMKRTGDDSKSSDAGVSQSLPPLPDQISTKFQQRHMPVKVPAIGCSYRLPSLRQRSHRMLENDQEEN